MNWAGVFSLVIKGPMLYTPGQLSKFIVFVPVPLSVPKSAHVQSSEVKWCTDIIEAVSIIYLLILFSNVSRIFIVCVMI